MLSSRNRRNEFECLRREQIVDEDRPLLGELRGERNPIRPFVDGAARDLGRRAQMDRRVVVVAQHVDLCIGQRGHLVRELLRNRAVAARKQLEAQTVSCSLRKIEKLLGIVFELVARRRRQRFARDCGPVIAAPQLVGARQMIERPPALALRQPEEAQCAMRLVMLRLELGGAVEGFDRLLRLAEPHQCDGPVVVSRDEAGVGPQRLLETADGGPVTALRRDGHAEVVRDRGIGRDDRQSRPIGALGLRRPPRLKMGHGVGDERAKFVRCLLRQGLLPHDLTSPPYRNWKKF